MRKIFLLLIIVLIASCKTKEKIIEKTVYQKDSTEVVELKKQLSVYKNELSQKTTQTKEQEQKILSIIDKLNVSENEKQNLKESFETTTKEYNEKGVLIKETYSKKVSELVKDLSKDQEQNKILTDSTNRQSSRIDQLEQSNSTYKNSIEQLSQKLQFAEKENKELKSNKTVSGFSLRELLIGLVAGISIMLSLILLKRLKLINITFI